MNPEQIKKDWNSRGYSFGIFKDPRDKYGQILSTSQMNLSSWRRDRLKLRLKGNLSNLRLVRKFLYLLKLCTQSGMSVRQITPGISDTKNNILNYAPKHIIAIIPTVASLKVIPAIFSSFVLV